MKAVPDAVQSTAKGQTERARKRRRSLALATALAGLVLSAGLCASLLLLSLAWSSGDGGAGWLPGAGEGTAIEGSAEGGDAEATAAAATGIPPADGDRATPAAEDADPSPSETEGAEPTAPSPAAAEPLASPSPRRVTATAAPPVAGTPLPGAVDWPDLPDLSAREPISSTAHFRLFAADPEDPWLADQAGSWATELEPLFEDVSRQLGGRALPRPPVDLAFVRAYEARCPARGLAATAQDPPLLLVFVDEETSDRQIRAVLAHEIAHHISLDGRFVGDGVLTEGIANWGGGRHTLAWQGFARWQDAAREYRSQGSYVSITDDSGLRPRDGEACLVRRDRVYNIRTAFVDWLIERIGLDRVLAMPTLEVLVAADGENEERTERMPDYEAATGLDLAGLERLWLRELDRRRGIDASARPTWKSWMAWPEKSLRQRADITVAFRGSLVP